MILPPHEGFGPGRAGAVGMIARRLGATPGFRSLVIGGPQTGLLFGNVAFESVRPAFWRPGSANIRFAAAIRRRLRHLAPVLV